MAMPGSLSGWSVAIPAAFWTASQDPPWFASNWLLCYSGLPGPWPPASLAHKEHLDVGFYSGSPGPDSWHFFRSCLSVPSSDSLYSRQLRLEACPWFLSLDTWCCLIFSPPGPWGRGGWMVTMEVVKIWVLLNIVLLLLTTASSIFFLTLFFTLAVLGLHCSTLALECMGSVVVAWELSSPDTCGVLLPWSGIEPMSPCIAWQIVNHWTREAPPHLHNSDRNGTNSWCSLNPHYVPGIWYAKYLHG